jgi:tRNA uridine 5-carboxymethylaminomethyl modification enzyme
LLKQVLKQPEVSYEDLVTFNPDFPALVRSDAARQVEIQVKYEGYIARQQTLVDKVRRLDELAIPDGLDYSELKALSREICDRLEDVRPTSLGQASRIPGVTPAAVSALMVYIKGQKSGARSQEPGGEASS